MFVPLLIGDINITPNPNEGVFSVIINSNKSFESTLNVIDVMGKVVYSQEIHTLSGKTAVKLKLDQLI